MSLFQIPRDAELLFSALSFLSSVLKQAPQGGAMLLFFNEKIGMMKA